MYGASAYKKTMRPLDPASGGARGLEKETLPPSSPAPQAPQAGGESRYRRVAKFFILIGEKNARTILANLEPSQVERISQEIARIPRVDPAEAPAILAEFQGILATSGAAAGRAGGGEQGGLERARSLLHAAFGPEKGERLLNRAVPDSQEKPFSFLEDFSGEQIAFLLRDEAPATAALVLARISPALSAAALAQATPDWKLETIKRIAKAGEVAPEVLARVGEALREKARRAGGVESEAAKLDGVGVLAEILKHSDMAFGEQILGDLAGEDSGLAETLKERLYTIDDIIGVDDRRIAEKLRTMEDRAIMLLVKGRPDAFKEKILSNISTNRRAAVREELEFAGPLPRKDSEDALKTFMAWFRAQIEQGQIVLGP